MRFLKIFILNLLRAKLKLLLKEVYPPVCVLCAKNIPYYNRVCEDCISKFDFTSSEVCRNCGNELKKEEVGKEVCSICINNPPAFNEFYSTFNYNKSIAQLISKFKYQDHPEISESLGSLLLYTFAYSNINKVDIIIPLPVSYFKLFSRKYNQSVLLAKKLSKYIEIPIKNNILRKYNFSMPQAGLKLPKRKINVKNSFKIIKRNIYCIKNRNLLLVDDVVTTGNTINEAAKILKKYGAKNIYVLACSKVLGGFKLN